MKGGYILLNGKFHRENEPIFTGIDVHHLCTVIRESFRAENNKVLFGEVNFNYLVNSLSAIGLDAPKDWDLTRLRHDVSRLLNKNHHFLAARVYIHFIQRADNTDYLLAAEEIPRGFYPLNEQGLMLDFYEDGVKSESKLSSFESSSRFLWVCASNMAVSKSKHNLILSNSKGDACEAIGSSFGYLKDDNAVFPSQCSGGYEPALNSVIIGCAKNYGFKVLVKENISHEDLLNADELFLIDNCLGIQKVLGLSQRRYYSTKTAAIALKLRELAIEGN